MTSQTTRQQQQHSDKPHTDSQGDHVRLQHSSDLLRQMALRSSIRKGGKKLKVITYREWMSDGHPFSRRKLKHNPAVILAKPGKEAGRKVVDYYYSLKGKTGTRTLKGANRQSQFLEGEFAKLIDEAYQQHSNDTKSTDTKHADNKSSSSNERTSAQSLPFGIEHSLSKLRVTNPDPSRSSRSSGASSRSRKSSPLAPGSSGSPWSSSETLHQSDHKQPHRRHKSYTSSAGSEISSSSSSSSTEALVILLDDDDEEDIEEGESGAGLARGNTWHGLESRLSKNRRASLIDDAESIEECSSEDDCSDCEECRNSPAPAIRPILPHMVHHSYPPALPPQPPPPPPPPVVHSPMVYTMASPPGFVPSPLPIAASPVLVTPPPGFIPLSPPLSMKEVLDQGRMDVHGQHLLDNYAASSPYAFRPSLYFSPRSAGTIPLPATPLSIHQYLGTPQRTASL